MGYGFYRIVFVGYCHPVFQQGNAESTMDDSPIKTYQSLRWSGIFFHVWMPEGTLYEGIFFGFTLWLFNIAMENDPFIDDVPIKSDGFPWLC